MIPDSVMDFLFWASMAGIAGSICLAAFVAWMLAIGISEWFTKTQLEK